MQVEFENNCSVGKETSEADEKKYANRPARDFAVCAEGVKRKTYDIYEAGETEDIKKLRLKHTAVIPTIVP